MNLPWEPDKGGMSLSSLDVCINALPLPEGWGPISDLAEYSQSLGAPCKGAWWWRNDIGIFNTIAATQTGLYRLASSGLGWTSVSRLAGGAYTGPGDGDLWTAAVFGDNFYVSNINDPLQVLAMTSGSNFANAPGSPPQAKFIATIGDFLFLAHLKEGATLLPRKWQHSKINDPTSWVIDGAPGASDAQLIPDGDDIMALLPMAGASARIIQKRARRALIFSPGSSTAFQQIDIDATRGAVAAHSCVSLGSNQYFFLSADGFVMNDEYSPIGAERVDTWFFSQVDPARLYSVKATADPSKKLVWVAYQTPTGLRKIIGYNWFLNRWFQSDEEVDLFITTVSPGYVLDDLPGVLNDYPTPPVDSPFWGGGVLNFGAFKSDGKLYLFAGAKTSAVIETPTMELAAGQGAYVWGAELLGNLDGFTLQHGTAFTPNQPMSWSSQQLRSPITNICPFSRDGKWHRFRITIGTGGSGTHIHGIRTYARPSTRA